MIIILPYQRTFYRISESGSIHPVGISCYPGKFDVALAALARTMRLLPAQPALFDFSNFRIPYSLN